MRFQRILIAALLFLAAARAGATEAILDFHSEIAVNADASMLVEETIRVRAEGRSIKRGIYRDFPTRYKDAYGNNYVVGFQLMGVLRDGSPEPHHTEDRDNGIRIYIGSRNVFLKPGEYLYTVAYRSTRQLGFFKDHDELYWNVTGNGWEFPIRHASAALRLPPGVPGGSLKLEAYTGPSGATGRDYLAEARANHAWFETTRPLGAREGLTIVAAWPKGFVAEPSFRERLGYFLGDNREVLAALLGLAVVTTYYLAVWRAYGKDPQGGVIIPLYEPPKNVSPAAARYLARMGFDHKAFASAVVNMAAKGYLKIEEQDGDYSLATGAAPDAARLSREEKLIADKLLAGPDWRQKLDQAHHALFSGTLKALEDSLKRDYYKTHFVTNSIYVVPGLALSIVVQIVVALMMSGTAGPVSLFMMVWLTGWTFGVFTLLRLALAAWRQVASNPASVIGAVFITLFSVPFLAAEGFGLWMFWDAGGPVPVASLLVLSGINYAFYEWLKAPTLAGRRLYDQLEGFRMYLSVAEKDRLNLLNPPERTPELFEKYLPYALALDVENEWAEQFAEVFAAREAAGSGYSPGWYSGSRWDSGAGRSFAAGLGSSLGGAISSASTAPGSSSGSSSGGGGGGSSGGGGGGGGGGGW